MQLSRKQVILVSIIGGVVLLLTTIVLIFAAGKGEAPGEPTSSPIPTALPTVAPTSSPTPAATVFRLPLVPQGDAPQATGEPTAGVFAPRILAPPDSARSGGTARPWVGTYDERTRDILAVGLRDGRLAALLFLRIDKDGLALAALPTDVVGPRGQPLEAEILTGSDLKARGEQAAALVEAATGRRYGAWLALDLACAPQLLAVTGPLAGQGAGALQGDGRQRAQGALTLMTGAAAYVRQASLWKLSAFKGAVGDAFASSLSPRELWSLFWTVRSGVATRGLVLSADGGQVDPAALENFFRESS